MTFLSYRFYSWLTDRALDNMQSDVTERDTPSPLSTGTPRLWLLFCTLNLSWAVTTGWTASNWLTLILNWGVRIWRINKMIASETVWLFLHFEYKLQEYVGLCLLLIMRHLDSWHHVVEHNVEDILPVRPFIVLTRFMRVLTQLNKMLSS